MTLTAPVGHHCRNLADDVRRVQALLNAHGAAPPLVVDGDCGAATVAAIRKFQQQVVGLANPDGRIDPGGRTWTALTQPVAPALTPEQLLALRQIHVDPRVKETTTTTRIIDAILPHLAGTDMKIVSGWLSDADQFWKVNYHWDLLLWIVEHSLTLPIDAKTAGKLQAIRGALLAHPPDPPRGYRTSGVVGQPVDASDAKTVTRRHAALAAQKKAFAKLTAALIPKSSESADKFNLAAAPVSAPGTSKHGSGYAVDIQGPAATVRAICEHLGATVVFDEQSHTHVEFAHGVA